MGILPLEPALNDPLAFFATAPRGVSPILAEELRNMGAQDVKEAPLGVHFQGDLALAYRACLWSRTASRILMPLFTFEARTPEALYDGVKAHDWRRQMRSSQTLAVDFTSSQSKITHTRYGAQKVKDAIVDLFREKTGHRPSVDTVRPDLRINVNLNRNQAVVSLDLSGEALFKRGYRRAQVAAPLKENLAAALLIRAGWPAIAAEGGAFLDPMCGSGTLALEAALMAGDIAPGLLREHYGFYGWSGHDESLWQQLLDGAHQRREQGREHIPPVYAFDADAGAVAAAQESVKRLGLEECIRVARQPLGEGELPPELLRQQHGLVMVNPPYGERLGEVESLKGDYARLGQLLRTQFQGWQAAVFTGNPGLGAYLGIRAHRSHDFYNGALPCKLLRFHVQEKWFMKSAPGSGPQSAADFVGSRLAEGGAQDFANRLRKNLKQLRRWARRENVSCYRLYDADMPEYALAIDLYCTEEGDWVHVQEYAPPAKVDEKTARARLHAAMAEIPAVLEVPAERVLLKVRRRQKGSDQYEKLATQGQFLHVQENGCRLLVNLTDYLDTGLFLDHRPTRILLGQKAQGKRFLNLFCYTGAATVHAAMGGAASTTSVDMSRTYLDWAKRNLALNGFREGDRHRFIQADCLHWLREQASRGREKFDLIFLDPPTFSTSKRMQGTFDVQRDHVQLLRWAASLLSEGGELIFSNNFRKFRMESDALAELEIEDITAQTLPPDFARNPRIHNCWRIRRKPKASPWG